MRRERVRAQRQLERGEVEPDDPALEVVRVHAPAPVGDERDKRVVKELDGDVCVQADRRLGRIVRSLFRPKRRTDECVEVRAEL